MANKQRDPRREATWRRLLAKHGASGLSVRAFCQQEKLSESMFYAWRRTIHQRNREASRAPQPAFLPAVVTPELPSEGSIAVELAGGRVLRLPESICVERLAQLVQALEAGGDR
jgi:transposase-like protein